MTSHSGARAALEDAIDPARLVIDPDVLEVYRRDHALLGRAGRPVAAVRAQGVADVVATLAVATDFGLAVVTRGAGTGLAGGANAVDGGIVLSTAGMNRIINIDERLRLATAECGVLTGDLASAVAERGLWYPPDPSSKAISTIGGNVATNAGGACCLKYGVTGDHVAALKAVLADGTIISTGAQTSKNVAGLDLTRLLVGSEGVLAVVVEVAVRLQPRPRPPATLVSFFSSVQAAGEACRAMQELEAPSLLEIMDETTIQAVEAMTRMGLDTSAAALVIAQCDSVDADDAIRRCEDAATSAGATYAGRTADLDEGDQLLAARRAALPALEKLGSTLLDDVCVPIPLVPEMLRRIEEIAASTQVLIGTFGHAGDGNLHPTIVLERGDTDAEVRGRLAFDEIVRAAVDLGGTVTGEHGVGNLKTQYLDAMVGSAERELQARIKAAFDPAGILNPGKAI